MNGRGHAASGLAAGAAGLVYGAPWLGIPQQGVVPSLALGVLVAGWTLAPDIDHPRATATTAFGPVSYVIHKVLGRIIELVVDLTSTRWDHRSMARYRERFGEDGVRHRMLTHTVPFAVILGVLVGVLASVWFIPTLAAVLGIAVAMLARLVVPFPLSGLAGLLAFGMIWMSGHRLDLPAPAAIGVGVALGCLVHDLGDMITKQGVPLFAPLIKIRGKRWWVVRLPSMLTFKAGDWPESVLIVLFMLITGVSLYDVTFGL